MKGARWRFFFASILVGGCGAGGYGAARIRAPVYRANAGQRLADQSPLLRRELERQRQTEILPG